jgi:hypothetical protein
MYKTTGYKEQLAPLYKKNKVQTDIISVVIHEYTIRSQYEFHRILGDKN